MVIKCPNCNHYVSDTAEKCPNCGFNLKDDIAKDNSSNYDELVSFLLSIENSEKWYIFALDNGVCISNSVGSNAQLFIEGYIKEASNKDFIKAQDAYQKFKLSEYYSDFSIEKDECNEDHILLDCTSKTNSPAPYIAKMIFSVYGITSPDQIEIIDTSGAHEEAPEDSAGILMKILCFMLPIVGLVLYFVKRNELPNAAKSYMIWAVAGLGFSLLVYLMQ